VVGLSLSLLSWSVSMSLAWSDEKQIDCELYALINNVYRSRTDHWTI
jgi:hypothetical protein